MVRSRHLFEWRVIVATLLRRGNCSAFISPWRLPMSTCNSSALPSRSVWPVDEASGSAATSSTCNHLGICFRTTGERKITRSRRLPTNSSQMDPDVTVLSRLDEFDMNRSDGRAMGWCDGDDENKQYQDGNSTKPLTIRCRRGDRCLN